MIRKVKMNKAQPKIQAGKNQRFLVPQSSKSQLKIQEMAFMLMAVVIFFIIAGLFFMTIKYREMYKTSNLFEKEKTLSTIAKLAETAEFNCGKPLCIDTDKLIVMKNRKAYDGFFPVTSLSVVRIFPKNSAQEIECNENNYPDCNLFNIYEKNVKNEDKVSTFVALCRQEKDENGYWYSKCELGKIVAGMEVKQAGK